MQHHSEVHNAYYHQLLSDYKKSIIGFALILILSAGMWEVYSNFQAEKQAEVQVTYEEFLLHKDLSLVTHMQQSFPNYMQTHLAALYKAKSQYDQKAYKKCIRTLEWILQHQPIPAIQQITESRLMSVYYETKNGIDESITFDQSNSILKQLITSDIQQNIEEHVEELIQSNDPQVQLLTQYIQIEQQK
jgi:predicted negative regulator of RcsB-dependent stress response